MDQELDVRKQGNPILVMRNLHNSREAHKAAVDNYEKLIRKIKRDYENVLLSTYSVLILDDMADSDTSLQRLLGVSAVPPTNWDVYTFQDYRIVPYRFIRIDLGPYLVYSFGVTTKRLYGRESALALSHAGYLGYSDVEEIAQDCKLVNALGIPEAQIYSFEEVKKHFGPNGLEVLLEEGTEPNKPISIGYNPLVSLLRFLIVFFDFFV